MLFNDVHQDENPGLSEGGGGGCDGCDRTSLLEGENLFVLLACLL